jgi:membrane-associated phospholipid phosphatase
MAFMSDRNLGNEAWSWLPPLAFAAAFLLLWATGTNESWFYRLNGWSAATGPQLWAGITIFGDALVLLALALPILWYRPQWAWALLVAAAATTIATHTLKPWLALPRPAAVLGADAITIIGPELRAKAMPSGHAAAALTLAGALVPAMKGRGPRAAILLLMTLVALSRVVVGAHWPMDVMAGALIGWLSGMISLRLVGDRTWMINRVAVGILALAFAGCAVALFFFRTGYPGTYGIQVVVGIACLGFAALIVRQIREPMKDA